MNNNILNLKNRITYLEKSNSFKELSPILNKLSSKYKELSLKNVSDTFIPEASSNKRFLDISEEDLIKKIGIFYWIFGFSYEQTLNFDKYRIDFIKIRPNHFQELGYFINLKVNFYKNDCLVLKNAQLLFVNIPNTLELKDIKFCIECFTLYSLNTSDFTKVIETFINTWNYYFSGINLSKEVLDSYLFKSDQKELYLFE